MSDFMYYAFETEVWTLVEPSAYFICASLPGIRPIFHSIHENALLSKSFSRLRSIRLRQRSSSLRSTLPESEEMRLSGAPPATNNPLATPKTSFASSKRWGTSLRREYDIEQDTPRLEVNTPSFSNLR